MSRSTATTGRERLQALLELNADFDDALDGPILEVLAFTSIDEAILAQISRTRPIDEPAILDRNAANVCRCDQKMTDSKTHSSPTALIMQVSLADDPW
jgi:hypothetical protein